jgi:hypothetical protein
MPILPGLSNFLARQILDDLAYVTKDQAETSVLFELIGTRYERRSMLITANQAFGEWGRVFPDKAMTLAAIDRLVHHATIFEMNIENSGSSLDAPARVSSTCTLSVNRHPELPLALPQQECYRRDRLGAAGLMANRFDGLDGGIDQHAGAIRSRLGYGRALRSGITSGENQAAR